MSEGRVPGLVEDRRRLRRCRAVTSPLHDRFDEFESTFERRTVGDGALATSYAIRRGAGPEAVVFLPGGLGRATSWFDQAVRLGPDVTSVLIDQAPTETVDGQLTCITSVLDREGLEQVVVVGTSLGGMLAHVLTTGGSASRVRSLVLCSSGLYGASDAGGLRRSLWVAMVLPERLLAAGAVRRVERLVGDAPDAALWNPVLCEPFRVGSARRTLLRQQRVLLELAAGRPQGDCVEGWSGPTLIVRAEDDALMPAEATHRLVSAHPGAAVRTYPTGGHLLAVTRPDDVAEAIGAHVAS